MLSENSVSKEFVRQIRGSQPATVAGSATRTGANKTHGLRRTNQDKQRAIEAALAHPLAESKTDGEIADHCGVSRQTVINYKTPSLVKNLQVRKPPISAVRRRRSGATLLRNGQGSLTTFVISLNLHRRHLTYDQRVGLALKILPILAAEAAERRAATLKQNSKETDSAKSRERVKGKASKKAAETTKVGTRTVEEMAAVAKETPELVDDLVAGKTTVKDTRKKQRKKKQTDKETAAMAAIKDAPQTIEPGEDAAYWQCENCDAIAIRTEWILIDGHNRYEICTRLAVPFETVEQEFESRADAKEWIIKTQFGRRNLPAYERAKLALQLENIYRAKAKENQVASGENFGRGAEEKVLENSPKPIAPINTRVEIAKVAGVSDNTIARVKRTN